MEPDNFYTTDTARQIPIFAALHERSALYEGKAGTKTDGCVSLAVGQSATSFDAEVAWELGVMLLVAARALDARMGVKLEQHTR